MTEPNIVVHLAGGGFAPSDWIALAAIAFALLNTWLSGRIANRQRRSADEESDRREAARVGGFLLPLLIDIDPKQWILLGSDESTQKRLERVLEQIPAARQMLGTIEATYRRAAVRQAAHDAEVACAVAVQRLQLFLRDPLKFIDVATADHADAQVKAQGLLALLRAPDPGGKTKWLRRGSVINL